MRSECTGWAGIGNTETVSAWPLTWGLVKVTAEEEMEPIDLDLLALATSDAACGLLASKSRCCGETDAGYLSIGINLGGVYRWSYHSAPPALLGQSSRLRQIADQAARMVFSAAFGGEAPCPFDPEVKANKTGQHEDAKPAA